MRQIKQENTFNPEIKYEEIDVHHQFETELHIGDFIRYKGDYWLVKELGVDLKYIKGVGVRLTNEISLPILKKLESQWMDEDYTDEQEWIERGVSIYSGLLNHARTNDSYKFCLGKLLFENAIHLKRNHVTRDDARVLFEEVLQLNPNHPKAHLCEYQLGFLNLYEGIWPNAIRHFEKAIGSGKLDYFQQLRAYCNLGICYYRTEKQEKAEECISKARELDAKENRFTPEIEMANLQIHTPVKQIDIYQPYTLLTKETTKQISQKEADEIVENYEEDGYVVLDCRGLRAIFNGPKDSVELAPRSLDLLKIVMTKNYPVSKEAISEELSSSESGLKSVSPGRVRVYISNLRKVIDPCFNEGTESPIQTVKNGNGETAYQWQSPYPYKIILPTQ